MGGAAKCAAMWGLPDWFFEAVTIAALFALPVVGIRAFRNRTYVRFVGVVVVAMIAAANLVQIFAVPGLDAASGATIVAVAALLYSLVRSFAMLPARRQWLADASVDPLVLAAPFEGRWRVAAGGPDPGRNHHLIASDQRFAYDFTRSDGPSLGSAILAPVAGRVVAAHDGQSDHRASFLRVVEDPSPLGNHVAIDSGRGVVFLCHLQSGSVLVHLGDTVAIGTPIGRCGNSGRTSGPHLHIHAQDLATYAFNDALGIPIAFLRHERPVVLRAGAIVAAPRRCSG
jgi:murein DD-endopeptidase MepM/ murein hydrolase activator NlpD